MKKNQLRATEGTVEEEREERVERDGSEEEEEEEGEGFERERSEVYVRVEDYNKFMNKKHNMDTDYR